MKEEEMVHVAHSASSIARKDVAAKRDNRVCCSRFLLFPSSDGMELQGRTHAHASCHATGGQPLDKKPQISETFRYFALTPK